MTLQIKNTPDGLGGSIEIGGQPRLEFGSTGVVFAPQQPFFVIESTGRTGLSNNALTGVGLNSEVKKVNFPSISAGKFTPTIAGWYNVSVNMALTTDSGTNSALLGGVRKNGVFVAQSGYNGLAQQHTSFNVNASIDVYLNGTTDYLDVVALAGSSVTSFVEAGARFTAKYVRP